MKKILHIAVPILLYAMFFAILLIIGAAADAAAWYVMIVVLLPIPLSIVLTRYIRAKTAKVEPGSEAVSSKNIDEKPAEKSEIEKTETFYIQEEYHYPPIDLLVSPKIESKKVQEKKGTAMVRMLNEGGVACKLIGSARNSQYSRYEIALEPGISIQQLKAMEDKIAGIGRLK